MAEPPSDSLSARRISNRRNSPPHRASKLRHLDIAVLMDFPTGRASRHVQYFACPMDHHTQHSASTMARMQPMPRQQAVSLQRKVQAERQRQASRRLADLQMRVLRQHLEQTGAGATQPPRHRSGLPACAGDKRSAMDTPLRVRRRRSAEQGRADRGVRGLRCRQAPASAGPEPFSRLEILLAVSVPTRLRTDRLLAGELGLSRRRIEDLTAKGSLAVAGARALRKSVHDGVRIVFDLGAEADGEVIAPRE